MKSNSDWFYGLCLGFLLRIWVDNLVDGFHFKIKKIKFNSDGFTGCVWGRTPPVAARFLSLSIWLLPLAGFHSLTGLNASADRGEETGD